MRLSKQSQRSARASNASTSLLSMATTYVGKSAPIRGPYLKHAFAKYVLKGEDAWLQQRDVDTSISASKGVLGHSCQSQPYCRDQRSYLSLIAD